MSCPACGSTRVVEGSGGFLTCTEDRCPNPAAPVSLQACAGIGALCDIHGGLWMPDGETCTEAVSV
jgi:hypothetical protein